MHVHVCMYVYVCMYVCVYVGHGSAECDGFFCPFDCVKDRYHSAMAMNDLQRIATFVRNPLHILFVLDCCYSGKALLMPKSGSQYRSKPVPFPKKEQVDGDNMYVRMYVCMYVFVCCVCVCVRFWMYVCMYVVCMYVVSVGTWICVCVYFYTFQFTRMFTYLSIMHAKYSDEKESKMLPLNIRAIQCITAGASTERVTEMGGHGVFTKYLLDGLRGAAFTQNWLSARSLTVWIADKMKSDVNVHQVPAFGCLSYDRGEFVFFRPPVPPPLTVKAKKDATPKLITLVKVTQKKSK